MNNRDLSDGRDPNSHGNIASAFELSNRAWEERDIYGKVIYGKARTMTASGLERAAAPQAHGRRLEEFNGLEVRR